MSCWSVTPVKARAARKMRLAELLPADLRVELAAAMFTYVVRTLQHTPAIDRVAVVSPELNDLPPGVVGLEDPGLGLNDALSYAARVARRQGATRLVVVPADLPTVEPQEIAALIESAEFSGFAIAPDRRECGTNALCVSSSSAVGFHFGPDSLRRHLTEAVRQRVSPVIVRSPGLAFDLDVEEDFHSLFGRPWLAHCGGSGEEEWIG